MKAIQRMIFCLLGTAIALSLCAIGAFAAESVLWEYTVDPAQPTVNANNVITEALNSEDAQTPVDVLIHGVGAEWYIAYDNIFKNTGRWVEFTGAVETTDVSESALPEKIRKIGQQAQALFVDMPDGEYYPGTAQVDIELPQEWAGKRVDLYEVLPADASDQTDADTQSTEEQERTLSALVADLAIGEDARLCQMLTESHDYLLICAQDRDAAAASVRDATADIVIRSAKSDKKQSYPVTVMVLLGLLVLALVGAIVLGVVLLVRRNKKMQAQPTGKKPLPNKMKKR